ncbi:MAG: hypothetical protein K9J82_04560 [Methylotenera sp.]|jgi:hypothetical protein|nr:hypothetical protein [Methylotenera sp.]
MLILERFDGQRVFVHTHKLIDALILRTAKAWSITESGSVKDHYQHLKDRLGHKTGFTY